MWGLHEVLSRLDYMEAQLSQALYLLKLISGQDTTMAKGLDDLRANVAAQNSVVSSVSTLLQDLSAKLKDAIQGDDDSAVEDLANQIAANSASLAQAVASNTQAAPSGGQPGPAPSPAPTTDVPNTQAPADGSAPAAPAPDMGNAS